MATDDAASRRATISNLKDVVTSVDQKFDSITAKAAKFYTSIQQAADKLKSISGSSGGGGSANTGGGFFGGGMGAGTFGYNAAGRAAIGSEDSDGTLLEGTHKYKYTGFQNALSQFGGGVFKGGAAALAAAGMMAMPSVPDALQLNLLANRQRFYGGAGGITGGFFTSAKLAQMGTATNPMDAAYAANNAMAYGFMPANAGAYGNALGGAALFSNLRPGSGLQGGLQAVGALNQARSVNMLRMIGINVRNNDGTGLRNVEDIVNHLWKILTNANNGKPPTRADISISAMSGNALDSILNQYFSGDENLRFSVLTALIQKASGGGLDIASLEKTGATTRAIRSTAEMNANMLASKQLLSAPILQGMMGANKLGSQVLNLVGKAATSKNALTSGAVSKGVQLAGFADAFSGLGDGAGGLLLGGASKATGSLLGGLATLFPALEGTAAPSGLAGLGAGLTTGALAFESGGLSDVTVGKDVNMNPSNARSLLPATGGQIVINVNMSGDYETGIDAGNAMAKYLLQAAKAS